MKADESVPVIYARALLESAADQTLLETVEEEAAFFAHELEEDRELRVFIENPRLETSLKKSVLEEALRSRVSDLFVNFLLVVLDNGREVFLREILAAFKELCDERLGRIPAVVVSAVPLAEDALAHAREALAAKTGKEILLTNTTDPSILGGLVLRFAGMVADGSVRTALDEIRASMTSFKLGSEYVHED